jgi:hypothetical protein
MKFCVGWRKIRLRHDDYDCQMTQLLKYLELIATYNEKDRAPVRGDI